MNMLHARTMAIATAVCVLSRGAAGQCAEGWLPGSTIGGGVNAGATSLMVMPNGDLVAAGLFSAAAGFPVNRIARWNGTQWLPMGSGLAEIAQALAVTPGNGHLYAGGTQFGGNRYFAYLQRWNGSSWSSLGSIAFDRDAGVNALLAANDGTLIVGGAFSSVGGLANTSNIARWNGSSWSAIGTGVGTAAAGEVRALAKLPDGDIIAGGTFSTVGGEPMSNIARWNGSSWVGLGEGLPGSVGALAVLPSGDIVAAGQFNSINGVTVNRVARWNGVDWVAMGGGLGGGDVNELVVLSNGMLLAGGNQTKNLARWNGTDWVFVSTVPDSVVWSMVEYPVGGLTVGGNFSTVAGLPVPYLSRYVPAPAAPEITDQPDSTRTCSAGTATFGVAVTPTPNVALSYRWQWRENLTGAPWRNIVNGNNRDGANVVRFTASGATTANLSLARATNLQGQIEVVHEVRAEVSHICSTSLSTAASVVHCVTDLTCEGEVNTADLVLLLGAFGSTSPSGGGADFNHDGSVNVVDLTFMLGTFGVSCP